MVDPILPRWRTMPRSASRGSRHARPKRATAVDGKPAKARRKGLALAQDGDPRKASWETSRHNFSNSRRSSRTGKPHSVHGTGGIPGSWSPGAARAAVGAGDETRGHGATSRAARSHAAWSARSRRSADSTLSDGSVLPSRAMARSAGRTEDVPKPLAARRKWIGDRGPSHPGPRPHARIRAGRARRRPRAAARPVGVGAPAAARARSARPPAPDGVDHGRAAAEAAGHGSGDVHALAHGLRESPEVALARRGPPRRSPTAARGAVEVQHCAAARRCRRESPARRCRRQQPGCVPQAVAGVEAAALEVGGVELHRQREVAPDRGPGAGHERQQQPRAVLEAAAPRSVRRLARGLRNATAGSRAPRQLTPVKPTSRATTARRRSARRCLRIASSSSGTGMPNCRPGRRTGTADGASARG